MLLGIWEGVRLCWSPRDSPVVQLEKICSVITNTMISPTYNGKVGCAIAVGHNLVNHGGVQAVVHGVLESGLPVEVFRLEFRFLYRALDVVLIALSSSSREAELIFVTNYICGEKLSCGQILGNFGKF